VLHLSDDEVIEVVLGQLERHLGIDIAPLEQRITHWPGAFAQYRPHHARWVDAVERALPDGLLVGGASYRGIGIPACIRQGRELALRATNSTSGL
jgi:oxygen-dependent protoporphyrinogen oxidase